MATPVMVHSLEQLALTVAERVAADVDSALVAFVRVRAGRLSAEERSRLAQDLDREALARCARFASSADQDRYLVAQVSLRRLLAPALSAPAAEIRLCRTCDHCGSADHGKPRLEGFGRVPPLRFNLAHAGSSVAIAVASSDWEPGVDIEEHSRPVDWPGVGRLAFSDHELRTCDGATDPRRARLQLWTRKEAAVKCRGTGLASPGSLRDVRAQPGGEADTWTCTVRGRELQGWDLAPAASGDVAASLALMPVPARTAHTGPPLVAATDLGL